jgi:hypothetical protein
MPCVGFDWKYLRSGMCVFPKYVLVIIMYAPLTVGSSPCLCSNVVASRSMHSKTLPRKLEEPTEELTQD